MLENQQIITQAASYINQSMAGLEVENAKIDFKASWYKLNEPRGINEFLKDTSAIANSFGPDGMIIIGFDDKKKELSNAAFADSGLKDSSQLPDLINRKVDRLFHFNLIEAEILGFNIGIIHIPPSIDKPHVIRNYQTFDKQTLTVKSNEDHKIFIRRSSSTYPASKSDLELMYYDRKNIIPDYSILSTLTLSTLRLSLNGDVELARNLHGSLNIIMENIGRRPVSISSIKLELSLFDDPSVYELLKLKSTEHYVANPIIIQSGQLINAHFKVVSDPYPTQQGALSIQQEFKDQTKQLKVTNYKLNLSNGETISGPIKTFFK
jgi:hypothetical protein